MMNCFHIFSSITKRSGKLSPELREQNPSTKPHTRLVKSTGSITSPISVPLLYRENEHVLRKFSFSELRNATKNFNKSLKIGDGRFGSVYKGSIKSHGGQGARVVVAIKRLHSHFMQEHTEWLAEVEFLGFAEHPNLVKLLGYCLVDGEKKMQSQRLLVYEYMPNKSLEYHLFSTELPPIPWIKRLQILLGAAHGLAYLHEGLETQVQYSDFHSADVLLDENFNPKLSDFGLERGVLRDPSLRHAWSPYFAYSAPEYLASGRLKSNSDLWSFGLVLYEILSGRKVIDRNLPQSEQILIEWVKQFPTKSKMFRVIMDPRLNNQYSLKAARKVAKLANRCLQDNWKYRPTMSEIVDVLQESIRMSENKIRSLLAESSTQNMVHAT